MRMLGIYNSTNKRFRKDGDEFEREAWEWAIETEGVDDVALLVNVTDGRVRREIRKMTDGLDVLAFFDHGKPKGLPRMRENLGNVKGLAATIAGVTSKITIILYSCSCGRGWWGRLGFRWMNKRNKADTSDRVSTYNPRDGYAVALCCELLDLGVDAEVWAHLSAGHTTRNPHVVAIRGTVADWFQRLRAAKPRTLAWKQWKRDLKGPLRFTFWQ